MPDSHMTMSRFNRRAYLLLLDSKGRLMLCGGRCGGWTVPQVTLATETDSRREASRFLGERFQITSPRYGPLHGIHVSQEGEVCQHDRPTVSYVFILRISAEESDAIQSASATHTRRGLETLKARREEITPEGIALLVSGYLEGWLPDGEIPLN